MLCGYVSLRNNIIRISIIFHTVRNVWSTWTDWSQATNSGPCPDTRTRTRSCVADTNMTGQPDCDGTCTLNKEQPERQQVATRRCDEIGNLATSTGEFFIYPNILRPV